MRWMQDAAGRPMNIPVHVAVSKHNGEVYRQQKMKRLQELASRQFRCGEIYGDRQAAWRNCLTGAASLLRWLMKAVRLGCLSFM